ncbi:9427_t:CDS:1 [Cetraspora pellucida]|uniref:9427_t:CDS:1 n=1 Tax=Cetraspora pellucida TaxID=1433469 RepID=A0A9N9DBD5_9GLOM|nr:9427_t:CDS:1 [Cetraspora pellucida]
MKLFLFTVTILALASLRSSGFSIPSLNNLSQQCKNTTLTILSEREFAECINVPSLRPFYEEKVINAIGNLSDDFDNNIKIIRSLEPELIKVSKGFCKFRKYSDCFIQSHIESTIDACPEDLRKNNSMAQAIFATFALYSPLHDSICFENKKGDFC